MNVEMLKKSNNIIFETIAGSHAYGTNTPKSDEDIRGIFVLPKEDYLGLIEPPEQVGDEKHDTTYYSLKRFFELAQTANPNIIELLWMPEDCTKIRTPLMDKLIENRELFISKKCFHTHSGYAYAQIAKAKGQNKKVHNPQPETRPKKEDFCWFIDKSTMDPQEFCHREHPPARPVAVSDYFAEGELAKFHASSLEHTGNVYRLYNYEFDNPKGIFRGDDMLVCESIPFEDEFDKFAGLLIYNKDSYEKAMRDWHSYWDWFKNRNDARWIDQEKGLLTYDQKNMMHCMRLLMSGENILRHGYPIVRFTGSQRDYLMRIRSGEFEYETLMAEVEIRMKELENLNLISSIPHSVDIHKIEKLYRELS